jgi:hypothetical protein
MRSLDLHDIERRSWRAMLQGGLVEIMFGGMMFAGATSYLISDLGASSAASTATLIGLHAAALLLMFWMRRRYVLPRVGRAKFSPNRIRRLRGLRILLAVCVLVTATLVALTVLANRTGTSLLGPVSAAPIVAVVAVIVLVPLGALAVFMNYPRFLLLGGLIVGAEAVLAILGHFGPPPHDRTLVFGIAGVISLALGLTTFVRFMRRVPRPDSEEVNHDR